MFVFKSAKEDECKSDDNPKTSRNVQMSETKTTISKRQMNESQSEDEEESVKKQKIEANRLSEKKTNDDLGDEDKSSESCILID